MATVSDIQALKGKRKIVALTCYDYTFAKILNTLDVDVVLVGDSIGMVLFGEKNTHAVTVQKIAAHTAAVAKGYTRGLLVADMPHQSYQNPEAALENAQKMIVAGAQAVKLEGGREMLPQIQYLIENGIAVVGHLGHLPQTAEKIRVQGRDEVGFMQLKADALALAKTGVSMIVLELMPTALAGGISRSLSIPTIGIGAGVETDGQILVLQDMLGLYDDFSPKFLKRFGNLKKEVENSVKSYITEVTEKIYPDADHSYS